jgi:YesN/AraC family two-component response regulator
VRIKKAVEWIEKTKLSISSIIEKVGFDNLSYFYKLFKKKYGVTPKEYQIDISLKNQRTSSK